MNILNFDVKVQAAMLLKLGYRFAGFDPDGHYLAKEMTVGDLMRYGRLLSTESPTLGELTGMLKAGEMVFELAWNNMEDIWTVAPIYKEWHIEQMSLVENGGVLSLRSYHAIAVEPDFILQVTEEVANAVRGIE